MARAPEALAPADAASLVVAGTTALMGYVDSGALRPVVSGVFPLAGIADAHQAFSRGGTLGKYVITVTA